MFSQLRQALPLFLALALFASAPIAKAQQIFGSIYGTVKDPSGGAVPNAKVTISDDNKGTHADVVTNADGNYTKDRLIPGTYTVQVEVPGFSKVSPCSITNPHFA